MYQVLCQYVAMSKISSYSHESHRPRQTQTVVMTVPWNTCKTGVHRSRGLWVCGGRGWQSWGGGRVTRSLTVGVGVGGLLSSLSQEGCSWGISGQSPSAIFVRVHAPIPRSVCSFWCCRRLEYSIISGALSCPQKPLPDPTMATSNGTRRIWPSSLLPHLTSLLPESPREAHSRLTHDNKRHNLYLDVNKAHFKKEIRISTNNFIITDSILNELKNLTKHIKIYFKKSQMDNRFTDLLS